MNRTATALTIGAALLALAGCSASASTPATPPRPATQVEYLDVPGDDIMIGCDGTTRFYKTPGRGIAVIPNDPRCP